MLISADSRQVFRGFDIGTDKLPAEVLAARPHAGIDVAEADQPFTLYDWLAIAREAEVDLTLDDFTRIGMNPQVQPSNLPFNVDDRHIILVDDVLHTGLAWEKLQELGAFTAVFKQENEA